MAAATEVQGEAATDQAGAGARPIGVGSTAQAPWVAARSRLLSPAAASARRNAR
jgi:hypothetical protein